MSHRVFIKWLWLPGLLSLCALPALAQPAWTVQASDYQFSMNVLAQVYVGGQPVQGSGHLLGGFYQGTVRGSATPLPVNGQSCYFLTLFSNAYSGDPITFRVYLSTGGGQLYESSDTVEFGHLKVLGSVNSPYALHFGPSDRPLIVSAAAADYTEGACTDTLLDVQAVDSQDSEGSGLGYSLDGGADAGRFGVDAQTGVLTWHNFVPDYDNPGDANGDNRYEVRVKVTDQSDNSDVQSIVVTVLAAAPPAVTCPGNKTVGTGDDNPGNCTTTAAGTGLAGLAGACNLTYSYTLAGATTGSGPGQVPVPQPFNLGETIVTYTVTDGSQSATCSFTVSVTDNENPVATCPASAGRYPQAPACAQYTVAGGEFDATAGDNCGTPTLSNSVNNAATLAGLVLLKNTSTTVTWQASDGAGRTGTCSLTITVGDCNVKISGTIIPETAQNQGVNTTTVVLSGAATGNFTTGTAGTYLFETNVSNGSFSIKPSKNINKLNGVTAADATAIQQHLVNIAPITSAYKLVAADVNKSNSVTAVDVSVINQALLGNASALQQFKTSWRFVPKNYALAIPPWGFPDSILLANVSGNVPGQDFYGIKTGDVVVAFANPANFGAGEPLVLNVVDRVLEPGTEMTVDFSAGQLPDLAALQLALRFEPRALEFVEVQPLGGLPLGTDHFGLFHVGEGEIRAVWSQAEGLFVEEAAPVFRLKFRVLQGGVKLSEVLMMDEESLPARVYTAALAESPVVLAFHATTGSAPAAEATGLRLEQNRPNPFSGVTMFPFVLPQDGEALLRITNATGQVLLEQKKRYAAGRHEEALYLPGAGGVLYAELITGQGTAARRLLAAER